jgi:hypothetical protein
MTRASLVRDRSRTMADCGKIHVWDADLSGCRGPPERDNRDPGSVGEESGGASKPAATWVNLCVSFTCSLGFIFINGRLTSNRSDIAHHLSGSNMTTCMIGQLGNFRGWSLTPKSRLHRKVWKRDQERTPRSHRVMDPMRPPQQPPLMVEHPAAFEYPLGSQNMVSICEAQGTILRISGCVLVQPFYFSAPSISAITLSSKD